MRTWPDRFAAARQPRRVFGMNLGERGFTKKDREAAYDWNTCAFGEARNVHGYIVDIDDSGAPDSERLWELGDSFSRAVCDNDVDAAEMLYETIKRETAIMSMEHSLAPVAQEDRAGRS